MTPEDIEKATLLIETVITPCDKSRSHYDNLRTVERINHWVYSAFMSIHHINNMKEEDARSLAVDITADNLTTAAILCVLAVQHFTNDSGDTLKRLEDKLSEIIRKYGG